MIIVDTKHVLVIGAGSVGKRHLQNLASLGCRLSAMDPRSERLDEAGNLLELEHSFSSMEEIEAYWPEIDGVVICSPPTFHVDQAIKAISCGAAVLLEKPVSNLLSEAERLADALEQYSGTLLLGYTYRWWKPLVDFRQRIKEVGKPLHAAFVMSAHLADWHPWERYQDFFMASRDLGGGALLDESHFLDLMLWFFGMPEQIYGCSEKLSALEIDTDDNVDLIARYPDGLRVSIHLDLYGRPHKKYITVAGEKGTLEWSFEPNRVRFGNTADGEWDETLYAQERNDMFIEVAKEFLEVIDGEATLTCRLDEGLDVLRMIEAVRKSTEERREVALDTLGATLCC